MIHPSLLEVGRVGNDGIHFVQLHNTFDFKVPGAKRTCVYCAVVCAAGCACLTNTNHDDVKNNHDWSAAFGRGVRYGLKFGHRRHGNGTGGRLETIHERPIRGGGATRAQNGDGRRRGPIRRNEFQQEPPVEGNGERHAPVKGKRGHRGVRNGRWTNYRRRGSAGAGAGGDHGVNGSTDFGQDGSGHRQVEETRGANGGGNSESDIGTRQGFQLERECRPNSALINYRSRGGAVKCYRNRGDAVELPMGFCCCVKCCSVGALAVFGIIFLFVGIGALLFVPKFIGNAIRENDFVGRDQNGSDNLALERYRNPRYDIKMQIWVISVQNPSGVVNDGEKANVTELGPFTYDIRLHKENVTFAHNDSRLFYRNVKTFFFNRNLSCSECELSSSVTVPNILFQKIVDVFEQNPGLSPFIDPFLRSMENVFVTISVDELLFKGYEDKLIGQICANPLTKGICERHNVPDRIGLFYGQNETDDGLFEVDTGKEDADRVGRVYSWDGMGPELNDTHWFGDRARLIRGTDGQLFPSDLRDVQKLQIFSGSLCRSFDLEFAHSLTFSDLPVRRFVLPISLFSSENQRAQGFCNPNSAEYFRNSRQPRIFLSAAHFRGAADEVRQSLDGFDVQPAEDDAMGFFDIEPLTGAAVRIQQRFQLSLGMLRGNLRMTRNMRNFIMPMIWMDQSAIVDSDTKQQLLLPLTVLRTSRIGGIVLTSLGTILAIVSLDRDPKNPMTFLESRLETETLVQH
uniref:Lysosome membrane protein 2 n=1 Tax=Globodera pallida TaxID=36090 RepID=A0A183CNU9_GLOPA